MNRKNETTVPDPYIPAEAIKPPKLPAEPILVEASDKTDPELQTKIKDSECR